MEIARITGRNTFQPDHPSNSGKVTYPSFVSSKIPFLFHSRSFLINFDSDENFVLPRVCRLDPIFRSANRLRSFDSFSYIFHFVFEKFAHQRSVHVRDTLRRAFPFSVNSFAITTIPVENWRYTWTKRWKRSWKQPCLKGRLGKGRIGGIWRQWAKVTGSRWVLCEATMGMLRLPVSLPSPTPMPSLCPLFLVQRPPL